MRTFFCTMFLIVAQSSSIFADPWGKDADLCQSNISIGSCSSQQLCRTPILGKFAEVMIGFHQNVISPADGPRSNFLPSSSQYTLDSMRKYGFIHGYFMGCDRLMRENDESWIYRTKVNSEGYTLKLDPVP